MSNILDTNSLYDSVSSS